MAWDVAVHARSFERAEVCYDWQHYIRLIEKKQGALRNGAPFEGLPAALQRLRAALMRRAGGDRPVAEVLWLACRDVAHVFNATGRAYIHVANGHGA